jgi:hypothetical protein
MNPPGIFNHFLGYRFLTIEIALCYFYIALFLDNVKINIVLLVSFQSFGREMSSRESTFFIHFFLKPFMILLMFVSCLRPLYKY